MMAQQRITPLTESGMLVALSVVLALLGVYLPVLGILFILIWALPIIVLVVRHGLRWGVMAVASSGVLMAILIEPMLALRMAISFGTVGLMLGMGFRKGWSGTRVLVLTLAVSILAKLAALGLLFAVTGMNPLHLELDVLQQSFETSFQMYEAMGMDAAAIDKSRAEMAAGLQFVALLLPLVVVMMGLMDTAIGYFLGGRVLHRLGHDTPALPPFSEWRLPQAFLYVFGFALVGLYWGTTREIQPLYQAALNLNMLALFAGIVEGLSLMRYVMGRYQLSVFVRAALYAFVLFNGVLVQILAFTGLFDMLFDYRRRFGGRWQRK